MELDSCLASFALLFVLVINGSVCETAVTDSDALHNTLIQRMNDIQKQLSEVTKSMRILNAEIGNVLFSCSEKDNFICDVFKSDPGLYKQTGQNSPLGTQKRSAADNPPFAKHRRFFRDLLRKRAMTNHLLAVMRDADNVLRHETSLSLHTVNSVSAPVSSHRSHKENPSTVHEHRSTGEESHYVKRTCDLNLGFHCETEAISDFADMYDFLSSENSPGKKRASLTLP